MSPEELISMKTEYLRGFNDGVDSAHRSPRGRLRFLKGVVLGFGLGIILCATGILVIP